MIMNMNLHMALKSIIEIRNTYKSDISAHIAYTAHTTRSYMTPSDLPFQFQRFPVSSERFFDKSQHIIEQIPSQTFEFV